MGCRSSCAIFETFSTAVEWIAKGIINPGGMVHILDDFLIISTSMQTGQQNLERFQNVCEELGIPLAQDKTAGPSTCLTFAGIELDTCEMSARLPTDKLEKAIKLVGETLTKNKLRLVELQSVIGYLNFACRVVVPGRAFLRRLNLSIGVVNQKHFVRINAQAKKDLQAWLSFLKQFKSYLSGRSQSVNIEGNISKVLPLNVCVPQGLILGPLLFIIYTSDLPSCIPQNCNLFMYADDSTLTCSSSSVNKIERNMNTALDIIHNWCVRNKLALNANKTECLLIGLRQKISNTDLNVYIADNLIVKAKCCKCLGVIIGETFRWGPHVEYVRKTVSSKLGMLTRIRDYVTHISLHTLFVSFSYANSRILLYGEEGTYLMTTFLINVLKEPHG